MKRFVDNSMAVGLINTKNLHHTIMGIIDSCVNFQGWMLRILRDVGG